jgi:hypothetical protein
VSFVVVALLVVLVVSLLLAVSVLLAVPVLLALALPEDAFEPQPTLITPIRPASPRATTGRSFLVMLDSEGFDPALPFAARLYEPPAPITATAARAANGFSFLLMVHSFVW